MTPEHKKIIDNMSYRDLFHKWRFAPLGNPLFHGDTGKYFRKVMKKKRSKLTLEEHVSISKSIGWG